MYIDMYNRIVAVIICLFFVIEVNAQDTPAIKKNSLRAVEIIYQANTHTPVSYQNISGKILDAKNTGQEPSFLLSETPAITVYSDAGNSQGYSYYRLRGMDQTRVNTTLDGMPLNEPEDQGAYFSNYPDILNSISKIQIQRGVGTSKNGTSSYAGSIQLFSPDLTDSVKTTFGIGYGSYNSFRVFGEYQTGIKNRKSLYVRASQIYTDGYKYHSSNNSQSVFISGGLYYDKTTWKINIMAGHQQNDMAWLGVADSLIQKDRRTNANSNERDNFTQGLIQLQNSWQISPRSVLNSSVYYTALKGNYDFDVNNYMGIPSDGNLFNYAFQSNFTGLFTNYSLTVNHLTWTTGIHGNLYNRQHLGSDKALGELYKNKGYKNELSTFSKIEYNLHRFNLFADLQYRYTSFDYKGSVAFQKLDWQFLNPKAGISVDVDKHTNLYYSIGRTSREPTRNDMFGGNDDLTADSTGQAILFNKKAESVTDHELGIRLHGQHLSMQFNGYYMNFNNEIVLNGKFGPNGLLLTDNVKSSYRTGLELSLNYQLCKHFLLTNNSSFNYSRIKEQSTTFSPILTPALIINQEIAYEKNHFGIAVSGRYQGKSFIDFANDVSLDQYVLINARAHYTISHYEVSFFLNNITNAKYINNGYVEADGTRKYFVQAPTNFYIAFKYSF
ncbi:iron complex outermembrane recepter protein [Chitinophaga sp. YR573]|nr:iron complex outermembrane recepter protein [Chitinophaga sp. YR573]